MRSACALADPLLVRHERASSQTPFSFLLQRVSSCSVTRSRSRLPSGQTSCSYDNRLLSNKYWCRESRRTCEGLVDSEGKTRRRGSLRRTRGEGPV
ncbi:hypothetical protein CgunFtcFv8_001330 [Champsocephalus gunnari]|uniref:Uncharacterized protein n=1 Tax=Champsocephalus gunnari TaxID=52237 RepID=A0AAN8DLI9_CHAGU|nr:hypothetical protein CgunFtcFv8_001329 [Champsocephalus gunnari]KAK5924467.1 hypothetical protein CgunFtcFv8_001330 [Champsocephalus gunnari]